MAYFKAHTYRGGLVPPRGEEKAIDTATIGRLVEDIGDDLVGWRRRLHQNPELSFEEAETSRFVYETLESFGAGFELSRPTETSVLARLVGENRVA